LGADAARLAGAHSDVAMPLSTAAPAA
jgi:hypothetical protein